MLMNKTKFGIVVFSNEKEKNVQEGAETDSELGFVIFRERERECLLSRFSAVQTVGSRRSNKQSRSTRRGLRVDIDLV